MEAAACPPARSCKSFRIADTMHHRTQGIVLCTVWRTGGRPWGDLTSQRYPLWLTSLIDLAGVLSAYIEVGVLQGLARRDALVGVIGQHLLQQVHPQRVQLWAHLRQMCNPSLSLQAQH